jgi:hypothetical protein
MPRYRLVRALRLLLRLLVPWQLRWYARGTPAKRRRDKIALTSLWTVAALVLGATGGVKGVGIMLAFVVPFVASLFVTDWVVDRGERRRRAAQRASASDRTTAS